MDCPYCGAGADLRDAKVVYGKNTNFGLLYVCRSFPECDTYVGAHERTHWPKGTLGNAELRRYRKLAHEAFDPLWSKIPRQRAYEILAKEMGLTSDEAHIGLFNVEQCKRVIEIFTHDFISKYHKQCLPILKPRYAKK